MGSRQARAVACIVAVALAACHSGSTTPAIPSAFSQTGQRSQSENYPRSLFAGPFLAAGSLRGRFRHVVVVVQENRTPDNLFQGLPGADIASSGLNSKGQTVALQPIDLTAHYDISHSHHSFQNEYDGGKMDGFDRVPSGCAGRCPPANVRAYGYVPRSETLPYFAMATQYAFADRMFQSNQGPSFPAHLYIIAGTSAPSTGSALRIAENPSKPGHGTTAGCDSPKGTLVRLIDAAGNENRTMFPCLDRATILDSLQEKHLTWRYYQAHKGAGLWNAVDAIRHLRNGPQYGTSVVFPPSKFLKDVAKGNLATFSVITPTADNSDHAGITNRTGPSWVAQVVNAVGTSPYWRDTAIFVMWDDWGGWYDHVAPPQFTSYSLGFRVPLIVISTYTRAGYVSHRQHEFGSILKFSEKTLGLESLDNTDLRSDDLSDCFDFAQPPRKFVQIPAFRSTRDFLREPVSPAPPDND